MPQVGSLARYIRRVTERNQVGEGNVEAGVTVPVDLMGIGRQQLLHFRDDGVTIDEAFAERGAAFTELLNGYIAADPDGQNEENQRTHYSQAISETFGTVTFNTTVLLKKYSDELLRLATRISELENPGAGL